MSIVNKGKLIVAAIASRPYVKAAVQAGYDVVAIDAFADADVQQLAAHCYQVGLCDGQLDRHQLLAVLDELDLKVGLQQFVGCCYGAGFEKTPDVLSEINKRVTVLGNSAAVVNTTKSPTAFFWQCEQMQIPFPKITHERPLSADGWLRKVIGGSGGEHIHLLADVEGEQVGDVYYQQFQSGLPISCLFVASGNDVEVVGFSEQWLDANDDAPFRYGGAVSHVMISEQVKERFTHYVSHLSQALGLVGLNSCDAIWDGNDVYLLEVNPRLSATMDLYTDGDYSDGLLMEKHIAASQHQAGVGMVKSDVIRQTSKAHQVVYATYALVVAGGMIWPEWVCDVPSLGSQFDKGMPVCTVIAEAETAALAKMMVNERVLHLENKLLNELK